MKKIFRLSCMALLFLSFSVEGSERRCYELSRDGKTWNISPELLCISNNESPIATIRWVIKDGAEQKQIASFKLNLLGRVRSSLENKDVYGIVRPQNSLFNELKISFDGKRTLLFKRSAPFVEEIGIVWIGKNMFYYRGQY